MMLLSLTQPKKRKRRKKRSLQKANLWWTKQQITVQRMKIKMPKWIKINLKNLNLEKNVLIFIMLKVMKCLLMTFCSIRLRKKWKALVPLKERLCLSSLNQSAVGLLPNLCGSTSLSRLMPLTEIIIIFYLTSCLSWVAKVQLEMKTCWFLMVVSNLKISLKSWSFTSTDMLDVMSVEVIQVTLWKRIKLDYSIWTAGNAKLVELCLRSTWVSEPLREDREEEIDWRLDLVNNTLLLS